MWLISDLFAVDACGVGNLSVGNSFMRAITSELRRRMAELLKCSISLLICVFSSQTCQNAAYFFGKSCLDTMANLILSRADQPTLMCCCSMVWFFSLNQVLFFLIIK